VNDASRLPVLDGWRGVSILLVLAGHLLPVGPKWLGMNAAVAVVGMALFFTLSGFLITSFLLRDSSVANFLIARFSRILPLAWVFMAVALPLSGAPLSTYLAHFLFYGNLPPFPLQETTAHLWSLCVEMQFYLGMAAIAAVAGKKGLWLVPVLAVLVTALRIAAGERISIVTWFRVDEILAGGVLALIYAGRFGERVKLVMARTPPVLLGLLLLASAHDLGGFLSYFRPYLAAWLVGVTILSRDSWVNGWLERKWLYYVAQISYALYVIHPLLAHTWLGSGEDKLVKYAKRPLLFAAIFLAAHVSTFHFERRFIELGKKLRTRKPAATAA
jgi:peptidoglycan/LPS O-acetylase OafA/YrhL